MWGWKLLDLITSCVHFIYYILYKNVTNSTEMTINILDMSIESEHCWVAPNGKIFDHLTLSSTFLYYFPGNEIISAKFSFRDKT